MKRFTYRIDDFTYNKVKLLAEQYHRTITSVITELIQIGFIEFNKRGTNENKNIYR
jgi:predicted transcriptional regulator